MSSRTGRVLQGSCFLAGPIAGYQPLAFAPLLFLTAFATAIAWRLDHGNWPALPRIQVTIALLVFACYIDLSCLWSTDPVDAYPKALELIVLSLSAVTLAYIVSDLPSNAARSVQQSFLYGLPIGFLICFGDMALGGPLKLLHRRWAPVNAYDREIISLGLLLFPAALIGMGRGYKWIALGGLTAYTIGILFLQSHSAMVGMVLGLAALSIGKIRPILVRYGLAGLFIAGLLTCIPVAFALKHYGLDDMDSLQFSFRHRIQIWNFTAERILHRPLFGYGLDGARAIPVGDLAPGFLPLGHDHPEPHPHNLFLHVWLELGLTGVILSGWFVTRLIASTALLSRHNQSFMLAMGVAWLAIATFAFGVWQGWWLALLVFLIAAMLIAGKKKDA